MALNNIGSLPEEILIEIFEYLSPNMIKTCCVVSKRWNEIINDSKQFMQKYRLKLDEKNIEEYKAMPMRRNYQAIELVGILEENLFDIVDPRILKSFIFACCTLSLRQFAKALNNLPALEYLELINLTLEEGTEDFGVAKPNLKTLKLYQDFDDIDVCTSLLEILDVNTLHELSFEIKRGFGDGEIKSNEWITFLEKQEELQILFFGEYDSSDFINDPRIFDFKFRLKSLTLTAEYLEDSENLIKFLSIHKDTLESLILGNIDCSSEIYKFIWNNLSLKAIDVNLMRYHKLDEEIDDNIEYVAQYTPKFPVESIKVLGEVDEEDIRSDFFGFFISSMPTVKHLDLSEINFQHIHFSWSNIIAHICNEMKSLTVLHMPQNFDPTILTDETIYFPKLVEFHMDQEKHEGIHHFIRRHSRTLQIISFDWEEEDYMELILDEVFNCENLKHVNLGLLSLLDLKIFNKLDARIKQKKPWSLNTYEFLYKFPDDVAYWNRHCRISSQGVNYYDLLCDRD